MSQRTRHIKVNKIYYDYKPKNAERHYTAPPVPWIQLKGKWLAELGFTIDTPLAVDVADGRLVLTIEEPAPLQNSGAAERVTKRRAV